MSAERIPRGAARASLMLAGLAWSLPFLQPHHGYPIAAFWSEWLALALGLAAALVLLRREPWRAGLIPAPAAAPLVLTLLIGMQAALGSVPYVEHALAAVFYLLWAAALVVLGSVLRREFGLARLAEFLACALLVAGLLGVLAGVFQLHGPPEILSPVVTARWSRAIYGNLAQPNHYAAYTAMACASAVFLHVRGRAGAALTAVSLALLAFALAVAGSRSSWLYLGAFAALGLAWRRARGDAQGARLAAWAVSLLPLFALAQWVAGLPLLQPELQALTPAQRLFETAGGIQARLQLAGEAWRTFLTAPVAGAGWGQFSWHHFLHIGDNGPGAAPGTCAHAHNIVLHLAAETGLAGVLLLAGAVLLLVADLWRLARDPECWWLAAILAVLGVHSLLEYPLWYAYFLGIAAMLAGAGAQRMVALRRAGLARVVVALFAASGVLNLAAVAGPYREFERLMADAAGGARPLADNELAAALERARREPLLAPYADLVAAHAIDVSHERLPEKLALNTRALHFAPLAWIAYQQAMLLALAGDSAAANRQFTRAARAYPGELDEARARLARHAHEYPAHFTPLLELAAARGDGQRGQSGNDARRR
ncbi:MAG: O-antigen ligase C-terminal domain-containing protein [Burkholderiales bacterium]|nr:O-antigen ligase C-terminal domain-containing protein [Burkholderiales bacterium]